MGIVLLVQSNVTFHRLIFDKMGNKVDKTHGGRGQALGSSTDPVPQKTNNKKKKFGKKQKVVQHHPIHHSKQEQREARSKLYQKKQIAVQSEIQKKEKILHIMEAADARAFGHKAPEAPKSMQYETVSSSSSPYKRSNKSKSQSNSNNQSSIFMADPSSKQALAAEKRIAQKKSKKAKNTQERRDRTTDLLFGDGLKIKDEDMNYDKHNVAISNNTKSKIYKSEKNVPLSSNSKTANAALQRFGQQKSNKIVNSKDRKKRTIQLLHGDGTLQSQDEIKAAPRQKTYY